MLAAAAAAETLAVRTAGTHDFGREARRLGTAGLD